MATMWDGVRQMATDAGRDPAALRMVVRIDPELTDVPLGEDRMAFTGTVGQVAGDLERVAAELGAHEAIRDLHHSARTADELLDLAQRLTGVLVG